MWLQEAKIRVDCTGGAMLDENFLKMPEEGRDDVGRCCVGSTVKFREFVPAE